MSTRQRDNGLQSGRRIVRRSMEEPVAQRFVDPEPLYESGVDPGLDATIDVTVTVTSVDEPRAL